MSKPKSNDSGGRSSPPSSDTTRATGVPGPLLPRNDARRKLVLILEMALANLDSDFSPQHPKSIWAPARDLLRNLPWWRQHVDESPMWKQNGAQDLEKELEACMFVQETAEAVAAELDALVASRVRTDQRAEDCWQRLSSTLESVLQALGSQAAARPKTRTKS